MEWLARVFASAVVRKLAYVLVAVLLAWAGVSRAAGPYANQEAAYAACMAAPKAPGMTNYDCVIPRTGAKQFDCIGTYNGAPNTSCGTGYGWIESCPVEAPWNQETHSCDRPNQCRSASPLGPSIVRGSMFACSNGCKFEQGSVGICMGASGSSMTCYDSKWTPTGDRCTGGEGTPEAADPNKPVCKSIPGGSYGECIKPNGEHCITTPNGAVLCNKAGNVGQTNTADGKEGTTTTPQAETPTPPKSMENPTEQARTNTSTSNSSTNTTINTTTTIYSGTGSSGGQSNVGSGGIDPSVPGGSGGDGDKDEGGKGSTSGGGDCGSPPQCVGGDPIMCSIFQQQWKQRCDASGKTAGSGPGDGDMPGWDKDDDGPNMAEFDKFNDRSLIWEKVTEVPEFDKSGFLGSGQCPAIELPEVAGVLLNLKFEEVCNMLVNISYFVMAVAYWIGIRIFTGSK